jgi:hypothetical protein
MPVDRFLKRSNLRPSKPQSTVTGFLLQFCHMPVTAFAFGLLPAGGLRNRSGKDAHADGLAGKARHRPDESAALQRSDEHVP